MIGARCPTLLLLLLLLQLATDAFAESDAVDDSDVAWAYGAIVDSITVTGNRKTRTFAILREMEIREGHVLNPDDLERDLRFITDLSPIASARARAESLDPGHVALRITVSERAAILVGSILPIVKYDFETGINYGVRWNERNFRGRLENLSLTYIRNERDDDDISFGWGSGWVGWQHISVGAGLNYFSRGDMPNQINLLEAFGVSGFVGLPLTDSRKRFSQVFGSLALNRSRNGSTIDRTEKDTILSPQLGHRFDSRDGPIRPTRGHTLFTSLQANYPLASPRSPYYRAVNELRGFYSVADRSVIAVLSHVTYQFGDFPDYSEVHLGGPSSLRGYSTSRFKGFHRWFGTLEWRFDLMPTRVFTLPVIRSFDVGVGIVTFMDSGIVWRSRSDFVLDNLHGTVGTGVRLYNPIRDVFRFDLGFTAQGGVQAHVSTGIRF